MNKFIIEISPLGRVSRSIALEAAASLDAAVVAVSQSGPFIPSVILVRFESGIPVGTAEETVRYQTWKAGKGRWVIEAVSM
ncbi:MAG TPA: hypothetical protein VMF06_14695 [Candidatus Limnocylindria bacterium]|nr:hypothetical protein [Candidatus Limnocylindria bacterium]